MLNVLIPDTREELGGATVTSGTRSTVIAGPFDLLRYRDKTFTVYNLGSVTLSGVEVQVNPDVQGYEAGIQSSNNQSNAGPNAGLWYAYNATGLQNIASGSMRSVTATEAYRWWRMIATNNDTQSVTASGWVYARSV